MEKLSPTLAFKAAMYAAFLLAVLLVVLTQSGIYGLPIALAVAVLAFSQIENYYLTERYIKKRNSKILVDEIEDVRGFLWWWIIIDKYGDTIWVNQYSLTVQSKNRLSAWLRREDKNIKANKSAHTTSAIAPR